MTTQIDYEQARLNMIEQQIRTWEVLDQSVLELLNEVHREDFVTPEFKSLALADTQIPLSHEQVMMTPKLEARLLQSLSVQKDDKVLEVGTGSGYMTALLASKANSVNSVDIFAEFIDSAKKCLDANDIENVNLSKSGLSSMNCTCKADFAATA